MMCANRKGIRNQYDLIGVDKKAAAETKIKVCVICDVS